MNKKSKNLIENKILMQILSVFIAITLWIIVGYIQDPNIDINMKKVPVDYVGIANMEKKGLTISKTYKHPEFSMVLRGKRSDLLKVMGSVKALVDISNITDPGTYTLDVTVNIPIDTVQIVSRKMSSIETVVEPIISSNIPIAIKQAGNEKNKETLIKSVPSQGTIAVKGAKSIVDEIASALITVDVSDMYADNTQKYKYKLLDKNNNEVVNNDIQINTVDLFVTNQAYTTRSMNVKIQVPDNLKNLYSVNLKSPLNPTILVGVKPNSTVNELVAWFADGEYAQGVNEYTLTIEEPFGVYIPNGQKTIKVKAEFIKNDVKVINIPVSLINIPSGLTAIIDKTQIDIQATSTIGDIPIGSVGAIADLSDLTQGTKEVNLTITSPENVNIIGTYKAKVTLQKK